MAGPGKQLSKTSARAEGPYSDLALHTIGWKAFQNLCAQVCEEEFGQPVEIFREAQDGGQDAVFLIPSKTKGAVAVGTVQCKHVSDHTKQLKLSDLTPELNHVKTLVSNGQADTYVFITNMSADAPVAEGIRNRLFELGVKTPHVWGKQKIVDTIKGSARLRALVPHVYGLGDLSVILDERAIEQTRALLGHWLPKLKAYVSTDAHNKAVRALDKHGAVLLLGNPSSGKSTIGAILSTIASENVDHTVLNLTSPRDFVERWNANDRGRFFWVDDAFGSNTLRPEFVNDWSSNFSKVQTAIAQGNKFLFTSRRHIYWAAKLRLGRRNLPAFLDESAVVNVGELTLAERSQILYNHVNFGEQTTNWKRTVKPYLETIAQVEDFLPGVAERLGNPVFTKKLRLNAGSLTKFMSEPREHLVETINEMEEPLRATLILVYVHRGALSATVPNMAAVEAVTVTTGVSFAIISSCLPLLNGSFLKTKLIDGREMWSFEHPTIADALTEILSGQPHMMEALLRGAGVDTILESFVCDGAGPIQDAAVIPTSLNKVLSERLIDAPDEIDMNSSLFSFLVDRASDEVFRFVIMGNPLTLNRRTWHFTRASQDPKIKCHARAHRLGLLSEDLRDESASNLEAKALDDFDLSFVEDEDLLTLIPPRQILALGLKLRAKTLPNIEDIISNITEDIDLDEEPGSHFRHIWDGLRILENLTEVDEDEDALYKETRQAVESEVKEIYIKQELKRCEDDEENDREMDWSFASRKIKVMDQKSPFSKNGKTRSLFDDVDR